jgi:hypothetical protein
MTEVLAEKTCTPCRGGTPPITCDEAQRFQAQAPAWELRDDAHRIDRTFRFRNFRNALTLFAKLASLPKPRAITPTFLRRAGPGRPTAGVAIQRFLWIAVTLFYRELLTAPLDL